MILYDMPPQVSLQMTTRHGAFKVTPYYASFEMLKMSFQLIDRLALISGEFVCINDINSTFTDNTDQQSAHLLYMIEVVISHWFELMLLLLIFKEVRNDTSI